MFISMDLIIDTTINISQRADCSLMKVFTFTKPNSGACHAACGYESGTELPAASYSNR
jgi:hypothetical protein